MGQRSDIITKLQSDILRLQHFCSLSNSDLNIELGPINQAFPNSTFPLAAIHEFISSRIEDATSSSAFITALVKSLVRDNGIVLWVSACRTIFPPALKTLGVQPDHFIFLDVKKEKDVLWVMDEALKCGALTAVIGEVRNISFNESRKLQLAVEQSQVTGFILRHNKNITPTASVSRWKISTLPSDSIDDLPGIGFPKWKVELLRMRNGKSGAWDVQWCNGRFQQVHSADFSIVEQQQKAG